MMLVQLVFVAWGVATTTGPERTEHRIRPSSDCEAVFGSAEDHSTNHEKRTATLEKVTAAEHAVWITHSGAWTEPKALQYASLRLVSTGEEPGGTPFAVVALDGEHLPCTTGLYEITTDASLGTSAQLLAIVDSVLLVEKDGELAFMTVADEEPPSFRMAWHAPFTIPRSRPAAPPPARKGGKRPGRRR